MFPIWMALNKKEGLKKGRLIHLGREGGIEYLFISTSAKAGS